MAQQDQPAPKPTLIVGRVAKVIDVYRVVINKGYDAGVRKGQRFRIYKIGEEVFDPETELSLGKLELIRGVGEVIHVQPSMATLESAETDKIERRPYPYGGLLGLGPLEVSTERKPFDDPELGDIAFQLA